MDSEVLDRPLTWWERLLERWGHHKPSVESQLNPASFCGIEKRCIRCGSRLLMDSQGSWFKVT